jgi:hypothetical protein
MKPFAIVLLMTALLLPTPGHSARPQSSEQDSGAPNGDTLIEPGLKIGPLKLGDSEERVLELFPKKIEDQEWENKCGTTYNWVDTANRIRGGNLYVRFKKGTVFQIESATVRFHTAEGITPLDPPDKIAEKFKDLRAYTLLTAPSSALGNRPLAFWVDKKKGIAFAFAYYPSEHKRYLYKIIVFIPNKNFCPEEETPNSNKWQEISPYTLEPPSFLSAEPSSN